MLDEMGIHHTWLVSVAMLLIVWVAVSAPTSGQEGRGGGASVQEGHVGGGVPPAGPAPRRADGKPDLTGNWNGSGGALTHTAIIEAHAGGFGILAGKSLIIDPADGVIPYQPWALAERNRRREDANGYEDPAGHCESYGMARLHQHNLDFSYSGNFLIIDVTPTYVTRVIDMSRREHLPDSIRLWMGDSITWWDGDTLVIETTNLTDKTWMDFGDFHGADARIVERYTMVDSNTIQWTMTINNPKVFTRPWTMTSAAPLRRQRAAYSWDGEYTCHEYNIDLVHLKNVYDQARGK